MPKDTRTLTEGAVLAALTVLIATIYLYIPLPLLVAVPLPLLILTYRHGMQAAIPVAFVAALLAGLVSHLIQGVILVLSMGALGLTLGEGLRQRFKPVNIVLLGTVIMVIVSVATFFVTLWLTGINTLETMVTSFTESLAQVQKLYSGMGVETNGMLPTPEQYGELIRLIFPAAVVLSSGMMAYLTYWLGGMVLGKLGSPVPAFPPFKEWIFPKWLGWVTAGLMLASSLTAQSGITLVAAALSNLVFIAFFLLTAEGLALAWSFISQLTVGRGFKALLLIMVFFMASPFLVWLGFADNFADFRNLRRGPDESHFKG